MSYFNINLVHSHSQTHTHAHSWSFLEIRSGTVSPPDEELAYFAGIAEGSLTGHLIEMQWKNTMGSYCSTPSDYCTKLEAFLSNNSDFMTEQIRSVGGDYWYQVRTQAFNETIIHVIKIDEVFFFNVTLNVFFCQVCTVVRCNFFEMMSTFYGNIATA